MNALKLPIAMKIQTGSLDSNLLAEKIVTNCSCAIKNAAPQILGSKRSQKLVFEAQASRVFSAADIRVLHGAWGASMTMKTKLLEKNT